MYYFIVNVKSRTGKAGKIWKRIEEELKKRNVEYQAFVTRYAGHASVLANRICEEDDSVKKIVVLGGDGTMNETINGIEDYSKVVLGYIPSGSGNDLARGLGIPRDPEEALERILNASEGRYVDHGHVDFGDGSHGRRFAVSAGIGFDASVCREVLRSKLKEKLNRIGLGKLIYAGIALRLILSGRMYDARITVDDKKTKTVKDVFFIAAMNGRYEGGGLPMAPDADPADGLLSVCMVHGVSRWKVLAVFPTIFAGKHVHIKGVELFSCRSIEVRASGAADVHTDGEVGIPRDSVRLSVCPEQVRMMV